MLCILCLIRETWLPKIVMSVEEAVANGAARDPGRKLSINQKPT